MQKEKFKVINFIRELLVSIDKNLDNFPKKDIETNLCPVVGLKILL